MANYDQLPAWLARSTRPLDDIDLQLAALSSFNQFPPDVNGGDASGNFESRGPKPLVPKIGSVALELAGRP